MYAAHTLPHRVYTGDMALLLEKSVDLKMDTLMRMQGSYDIAQIRKRENKVHVRRLTQLADVNT